MKKLSLIVATAALMGPLVLASPSQARTAFQDCAQGRGAYVTSKDHPRGGLQDAAQDFGALPPSSPDFYNRSDVPPPYGYDAPGY